MFVFFSIFVYLLAFFLYLRKIYDKYNSFEKFVFKKIYRNKFFWKGVEYIYREILVIFYLYWCFVYNI